MLRILSGRHRGRPISAPKTGLRPSMAGLRAALFNILAPHVEGTRLLDLFSGSGAVGLEALSRGAGEVTFVERERRTTEIIKKNLSLLGEEGNVVTSDAIRYLDHFQGAPFDILFADPPYDHKWAAEVLERVDQRPILRPRGFCFIEVGKQFTIPELKTLEFIKERRYGTSKLYQWQSTLSRDI